MSLVSDKRPGGGLVILHPSQSSVLLVRDSRNQKWGFPKGRYELEDHDLLATAIRETREETGFLLDTHYTLSNKARSCANTRLVLAQALTPDLPITECAEHNVAEIAWVPFSDLDSLSTNLPLRLWAKKEGWLKVSV